MKSLEIDAIIFDFDGVLAESVSVKGDAFVELYKDQSTEIQRAVLSYHEEHGGVSRFDKIRYYEEHLLGKTITDNDVAIIADRFSEIVETQVIQSKWVAGAEDFLKIYNAQIPLYMASATPEEELKRIVERRGMNTYFKGVYGSPKKKHEHIINIATQNNYAPNRLLMVGDAITDYEAAQKAGAQFIGRLLPNKPSPFPIGTKLIHDLTELDQLIGGL